MRKIMLSSIVAVGFGLAAMTSSSAIPAAPVNANLTRAANDMSLVQRAWYNRWGRWCSRRCNWRRCWVICR